jgi:hypothetical protein
MQSARQLGLGGAEVLTGASIESNSSHPSVVAIRAPGTGR